MKMSKATFTPGQHVARQHVARTSNMLPATSNMMPGNMLLVAGCPGVNAALNTVSLNVRKVQKLMLDLMWIQIRIGPKIKST